MLKNYIKIAWRSILRNRYFSLIHIIGLGIGMSCCLFIFFYIKFHLSYDEHHDQSEEIYRIVHDLHLEKTIHESGTSYAIFEKLKSNDFGLEEVAFSMVRQNLTLQARGKLFSTNEKASFVSDTFFDLFRFHFLSGSPNAMRQPNVVAITASTAERLFGNVNPIGQIISIDNKYPLKVVALIDDQPTSTSLKADYYISLASVKHVIPDLWESFFNDWGFINTTNQLFIRLKDPARIPIITKTLQDITNNYFGDTTGKLVQFKAQPLKEIHFDKDFGGTVPKSTLRTLGIIALIILLVASLNYINLSLVQYARKSVEIGTRKLLGSSRWQLFFQFFIESLCISGLACLLAIGLLVSTWGFANNTLFAQESLPFPSAWNFCLPSMACWLCISLLSSIYPALTIGRLAPMQALKDNISLGANRGRAAIVFVQNLVSQGFIIATIVIIAQVNFLRTTDVGFDRSSLIQLALPKEVLPKEGAIRAFLDENQAIERYSFCFKAPALHDARGGTLRFDQREEWEAWPARATFADSSYITTLGIKLIAGQNIRNNQALPEYLVNEKMAQMLGFNKPQEIVGKHLLAGGMHDEQGGVIVGVVENYNTQSLRNAIEPTVIGYDTAMFQTLLLKIKAGKLLAFRKDLEGMWAGTFPDKLLHYQLLDEQIEQLYVREEMQEKLIRIAACLTIMISSLGLLGLISLSILKRTKELGIRKVLGASVYQLSKLLSIDFIRLILLAFITAVPLAWWLINKWLADFSYRIELKWWMFGLAGIIAMLVTFITIGYQAIKAAIANPVDSLRNE